ncbi:hypothetical protein DFH11DRAFT_1500290 [Phellopilus nigrolimitatus]|nr:hypothetical protein DFH11DRAFT_1500290 [Phellopilus nigrolimitatus]
MPFTHSPTSSQFHASSRTASTVTRDVKASKQLSLDTQYKGPVIPPSTKSRKKHRTLVLCFDGTGDQFDNDNSNVVQFCSLLKKGDNKQQMVYYQAGIGTYTIPQIATPIASKVRKTLDMMLGSSLHHHVMGGYEFLMENFREGDRICIFGFSRGAYTARALAGMIEKVGLLPAGNHQQVPFAYKMYMKDDKKGWQQSVLFKQAFSMDVDIEFVGVWDTVDSVGIFPRHVPFTKNNTCVKTFRHAIALDEHRVKFKANLYDKIITQEAQNADFAYTPFSQRKANWKKRFSRKQKDKEDARMHELELNHNHSKRRDDNYNEGSKLQDKYTDKSKQTDVLEVWFSGCHTDVGGGSVTNDTQNSLARIPLRWMIRQCFLTECGIQFEADRLHVVGFDPHALYPFVLPRPAPLPVSSVRTRVKERAALRDGAKGALICQSCSADTVSSDGGDVASEDEKAGGGPQAVDEEHEELHDALSPAFDQLAKRWAWWILEIIPLVHRHEKEDGTSVKVISVNNGRARVVTQQRKNGIKVHRSVKMRMEAEAHVLGKKYQPRVKFHCEPTWVD